MKSTRLLCAVICGTFVVAGVVSQSAQSATQIKPRSRKAAGNPNFVAHAFTPSCSNPSYPAPAPEASLGIDGQCDLPGSGGAEADQNTAKNNFCASGDPKEMTIDDLKDLQKQVKDD